MKSIHVGYGNPQETHVRIFFSWKCYNNGLPVLNTLHHRNCVSSTICPLCNMNNESIIHALRDCLRAIFVWSNYSTPPNFFSENLQKWLLLNATNFHPNHLNIPQSTIFLYTIRTIWMSRNNFIFQNVPKSSSEIVNLALCKATEYWSNRNCPIINLNLVTSNVSTISKWSPPPSIWIKLNTDGSMTNHDMGACGCLRDMTGTWIRGYSNTLVKVMFFRRNYGWSFWVYKLQHK